MRNGIEHFNKLENFKRCVLLFDSAGCNAKYEMRKTIDALRRISEQFISDVHEINLDGGIEKLKLVSSTDLVFNLCAGLNGDFSTEYCIPKTLETRDIAYTGCSSTTFLLSLPKSRCLAKLKRKGVAIPERISVRELRNQSSSERFVLKHEYQHGFCFERGTIGIFASDLLSYVGGLSSHKLFVERFVEGDEFRVLALHLSNRCLYGFARITKTHARPRGNAEPAQPPSGPAGLHHSLDVLSQYFRSPQIVAYDFIFSDRPVLIDVNPNPGWSDSGYLNACLESIGMAKEELIYRLFLAAQNRQRSVGKFCPG